MHIHIFRWLLWNYAAYESINIRPAKNFAYIKNKSVRRFLLQPVILSLQFG